MNGSKPSNSPTAEAQDSGDGIGGVKSAVNGHRSPQENGTKTEPDEIEDSNVPSAVASPKMKAEVGAGDEGAASEAETLITSPVKRKEAEKKQSRAPNGKAKKTHRHRIGGLPVPSGDNDDENDSAFSPAVSVEKAASTDETKEENMDIDSDKDGESDDLSSARSEDSDAASEAAPRSRATSERSDRRSQWQNPRKRKHRASSVSLPNKRPSIDVSSRKLRGLQSEDRDGHAQKSPSPNLRSHRRAASTQSAAGEGGTEGQSGRRKGSQVPTRETKSARSATAGWEESDGSSETTSHGRAESKRPRRGVGRSTSTPGRPSGREHKRHVNIYGFTRLAEACENDDLDLVKEWRQKDPEQLELAEFAGNKPLQIASLKGNVQIVNYLIEQGVDINCANLDKDTPLIDASENGHLDVVKSLLKAGVDPLRQNMKGQHALDVVTDETDDAEAIRAALRNAIETWNKGEGKSRRGDEEVQRHRAGPSKELHLMAPSYDNLLKLVQNNDRNGVSEFLGARIPVDNNIIAAAAKTGDLYLLNMLLAEMRREKAFERPERPMLAVLGTSHFEMVKALTELDQFQPNYRDRMGRSWSDLAEGRQGPRWREERALFQALDKDSSAKKERRSSSPVYKREGGKRRANHRAPDDSDEEDTPKRKNGRRLMSKRDMRRRHSVASSADSNPESKTPPEQTETSTMKPPGSPPSLRTTPGRTRTQSLSAQPADTSPRTSSRRSSSLRGSAELPLPTVEEKGEGGSGDTKTEEDEDMADKEALEAEERRKVEEEAALAATQLAAEEEQARLAAEKQKAEEERKQEEERLAEEARKAEEERLRKEREISEAKRIHRERVIASLPSAIAHALDPGSTFNYDEPGVSNFLLAHVAPLQVLKSTPRSPLNPSDNTDPLLWLVNAQAAPLLGPRGLELLLRPDVPGFEGSWAQTWETIDVTDSNDIKRIESLLGNLPPYRAHLEETNQDDADHEPFESQVQKMTEGFRAMAEALNCLRNGEMVLRFVRLDDVMRSLHPCLRGVSIDVWFHYLNLSQASSEMEKTEFVQRIGQVFDRRPRPRKYIDGNCVNLDTSSSTATVEVKVRYRK